MLTFRKRIGFTLAEVLVTLGIIGVVASLTIPQLVTAYEKQATVTAYKKVYSTLTNAVKLSEVDNGPVDSWDFSYTPYAPLGDNPTFMNTYFTPYISTIKKCTATQGCWAAFKTPAGNAYNYNPEADDNFLKYVLADGSTLAFIFRTGQAIEIAADINGPKKPNIVGKDIFHFWIINKNSTPSAFFQNFNNGGLYPAGYGIAIKGPNYSTYGCGKDVSTDMGGTYCGMKIIQDGYEIKSDYPW